MGRRKQKMISCFGLKSGGIQVAEDGVEGTGFYELATLCVCRLSFHELYLKLLLSVEFATFSAVLNVCCTL